MRLRLFDRLLQLMSWRPGSRDAGRDRKRESRAGGHRKSARFSPRASAVRPPARLPVSSSGHEPTGGAWLSQSSYSTNHGNTDRNGTERNGAGRNGAGRNGTGPNGSGPNTTGRGNAAVQAAGGGGGRARIREAPIGSAPVESVALVQEAALDARPAVPRQPWYQVVGPATRHAPDQSRPAAMSTMSGANTAPPALAREAPRSPQPQDLPYTTAHPRGVRRADGRTNCGPIERILWRQWDETRPPPPQAIAAVERLASFPRALQEKLANGLDGIYIGAGGVPELDHMTELRGVPLPSGRATWDACAGAYGERKIVVGTRPSPTPDVMCHEVGHALDDLDSPPGKWQSDSSVFRLIYDECQPYIASDFHRQRGGLGRKEFFADAFAAIASGQRPALVDMLGGNTRCALKVMLYFNRRYGI
jgi:hypothetical protein